MKFETKRLFIRQFETLDYEKWASGYENRLPPQNNFDIGRVERHDKKYYYDFISALAKYAKDDKGFTFGVFDKATSECVGVLEIIVLIRNDINWGSIGVSVHNQFWKRGYGFEIAERGLAIANDILGIRRLECQIEIGNIASVNLFKKLGFEFEGVRKQFARVGAEYADMEVYVKLLNS